MVCEFFYNMKIGMNMDVDLDIDMDMDMDMWNRSGYEQSEIRI